MYNEPMYRHFELGNYHQKNSENVNLIDWMSEDYLLFSN